MTETAKEAEAASSLDDLEGLSELADPLRRKLYDCVADASAPVRRDAAAEKVGISRELAAYHLDRLAEAGLLAVTYRRPDGRGGPGAGRPAKYYERSPREVTVSVPPRNYPMLARILTDAVANDPQVEEAIMAAAESEGEAIGETSGELLEVLSRDGYEPEVRSNGEVHLRNCPFHSLAQHQTELVCGLNVELLRGLLSGRGENPQRVELRPAEGRCCVVINPEGGRCGGC